ncbi:Group XIIA secretory phospholipase A2 [Tupaia chinensis]|uniref:Group XIIA secretory phospholipase A2 n=1 Tax=Tupaia chinensis TaxID=246437 RepID=L8YBA8_TUPCH|nr:Group XIIA secretory phospholipase A2 [Tupaia chinensis]
MALLPRPALALLLVVAAAVMGQEQEQTTDWRATLKTIRNGVHRIDTYLNAALDLLGGEDGLCRYKCSDGSKPLPRYGFKPSPPSGCGSPLFGVHLNVGIPSLTRCCNQHDRCYETCGHSKSDCDEQFQACLSKICRDVQRTLGLAQHVQDEIESHQASGWVASSQTRALSGRLSVLSAVTCRARRAGLGGRLAQGEVHCCRERAWCDSLTRGRVLPGHELDTPPEPWCAWLWCTWPSVTLRVAFPPAACETAVGLLFDSVIHLGCKPYLDSQRAACRCRHEEKTDL